jgi:NAD(P)-dependent dehydrogenase (short-subunit alcohol dehydrogenase family)
MKHPATIRTSLLAGRRVLVAGGDGEIGRVICAVLSDEGADVAVAGIDGNSATTFAATLSTGPNRAAGYQADLTNQDAARDLTERVAGAWGGLDVAINCAGVLKTSPAEEFDAADWRAVVETNLTGAFFLSQAAARVMIKNGEGGRIIHLTSVRAALGLAIGGFAAYGASKAGVHLLVRQLAAEWGKHQIAVNAVAAGFVQTALSARAVPDVDASKMVTARTPLGRVADPREIANAVAYLAGPRSDFITGQVLYVDGGLTASQ